MINAENIGKRIKLLRKKKNVSQEKMALDLGMYQADISNLERAMSGSGITDLSKLQAIADYFGVSLVYLLMGDEPEAGTPTTNAAKAEEVTVQDYILTDARYGQEGFSTYASELTLTAPDGKVMYVSFAEVYDVPRFFKTDTGIFEELMAQKFP